MTRWEYAHLSAGFDGQSQEWTLTLRVPTRNVEQRSAKGIAWIFDILNELGRQGWELVDRTATSTGGNAFVAGWQFIFKRPAPGFSASPPPPPVRSTGDRRGM